MAIRKLNIVWPSWALFEAISWHCSYIFIESPEFIASVIRLHVKIANRRMMGGMLTVYLGSIFKLGLECFSQDRVKWFFLVTAHVNPPYSKGYNLFKPFQWICNLRGFMKEFRSKSPVIYYSLKRRPWFKYLDWKRDMSYCEPFHQRCSQFFQDIN